MISSNSNANNSNSKLITNMHTCVTSMLENSYDYSVFDMYLVFNYINHQITYYYIISTISAADQAKF